MRQKNSIIIISIIIINILLITIYFLISDKNPDKTSQEKVNSETINILKNEKKLIAKINDHNIFEDDITNNISYFQTKKKSINLTDLSEENKVALISKALNKLILINYAQNNQLDQDPQFLKYFTKSLNKIILTNIIKQYSKENQNPTDNILTQQINQILSKQDDTDHAITKKLSNNYQLILYSIANSNEYQTNPEIQHEINKKYQISLLKHIYNLAITNHQFNEEQLQTEYNQYVANSFEEKTYQGRLISAPTEENSKEIYQNLTSENFAQFFSPVNGASEEKTTDNSESEDNHLVNLDITSLSEEIKKQIEELPLNSFTHPYTHNNKWHIFQLVKINSAAIENYDEYKQKIISKMKEKIISEYITQIISQYKIERFY
jgi:hypothetical protein